MFDFKFKDSSDADVAKAFRNIDFKTQPTKHQLVSILFAIKVAKGRVMLAHGVGTGKSLVAIYVARLLQAKKILIVCKSSAVKKVWLPEMRKHMDFDLPALVGSREERLAMLDKPSWAYVINYEGLRTLYSVSYGAGCTSIEADLFIDNFDCIIFDEIHKLRTPTSIMTSIGAELSKRAKYVIGLTGTMMNIEYYDLWSQYYVLDLGRSLGDDYTYFIEKYYDTDEYMNFSLKYGAEEAILKKLARSTIRYSSEECIDLPPKKNVDMWFRHTPEQLHLIRLVSRGESFEYQGVVCPRVARLNMPSKLQQICAGFLNTGNEETPIVYVPSRKYQGLIMFCKKVSGKIIIFHTFIEEGVLICKYLKRYGITYEVMQAGRAGEASYRSFMCDPSRRCFVVSVAMGCDSIDLTVSNIILVFSTDTTAITREQLEGRIWRNKQTKPCIIVDMVTVNGADDISRARGLTRKSKMDKFQKLVSDYHAG